jgi:hypothetical protein
VPGYLNALLPPEAARKLHRKLGIALRDVAPEAAPKLGVTLTREQLEEWAGEPLSDEQVGQVQANLCEALKRVLRDHLNEAEPR